MDIMLFSVLFEIFHNFIDMKSDLNQQVFFPLVTCKSKLLVRNKNNYQLCYVNQSLVIHFLSAYYLRNVMKQPNPISKRFVLKTYFANNNQVSIWRSFSKPSYLKYLLLSQPFFLSLFSAISSSYELHRAENKCIPEVILHRTSQVLIKTCSSGVVLFIIRELGIY